ncbi:MAG: hypothetical protein P8011_01460 [Acidihalobacter sp.]|uniref:RepB family protein n=1 Tax=Acidihalobacter sp. TaxID=1872108 RepID=UPI00307D0C35
MARPAKNSKPMTNAERQHQYRLRQKLDILDGQRRLNTFIDGRADMDLRLLARHHGLSQKAMLEKLINDAHNAIVDSMEPKSSEWCEYFQADRPRSGELV